MLGFRVLRCCEFEEVPSQKPKILKFTGLQKKSIFWLLCEVEGSICSRMYFT
jgi:hypothetical protein